MDEVAWEMDDLDGMNRMIGIEHEIQIQNNPSILSKLSAHGRDVS